MEASDFPEVVRTPFASLRSEFAKLGPGLGGDKVFDLEVDDVRRRIAALRPEMGVEDLKRRIAALTAECLDLLPKVKQAPQQSQAS